MDFLDKIYFDNTVKNYLIVAAIILVILIIKRFLSRYIASALYLPIKKLSVNIDKKLFINLVIEPLEVLLVLGISMLALDRLNFPQQLNVKVYHTTLQQIIESLSIGIFIIAAIWVVLRLIDFIVVIIQHNENFTANTHNQLILFFRDFLKVIVVILGGVVILKCCFNVHIGNLITGLSLVGAALALAAKESLENLIASFIIFFDKPFTTGDLVRVNNFQGFIERIGLRSTKVRTPDRTLVIIPNKQMVDSIVDNWSMRNLIRNEIRIELAPQTSSQKIRVALDETKKIFQQKENIAVNTTIFLQEVTKNSALIFCEYFAEASLLAQELNQLKEYLNLEIKKMLEQNKIEPAIANSFIVTSNIAKEYSNAGDFHKSPL